MIYRRDTFLINHIYDRCYNIAGAVNPEIAPFQQILLLVQIGRNKHEVICGKSEKIGSIIKHGKYFKHVTPYLTHIKCL